MLAFIILGYVAATVQKKVTHKKRCKEPINKSVLYTFFMSSENELLDCSLYAYIGTVMPIRSLILRAMHAMVMLAELRRHPLLDFVVDFRQNALDVQAARAFGVGLAAVQRENLVLRFYGAEDIEQCDLFGVAATATSRRRHPSWTRRCRRRAASRASGESPPGWCSRCKR